MPEYYHPNREKLHRIIFGTDTFAGKLFDVILIIFILMSVLVVMLDSILQVHSKFAGIFKLLEWFFTIVFTVEYILRLYVVKRPLKYATSFFGVVDLLSVLPTYLTIIFATSHYFIVIRILRLLRIFRILKLIQYLNQADALLQALKASRAKILIFLFAVFNLVIILGSIMYVVEGEANGFTSIPKSIYWAIVTLTTVGYGDISPKTPVGQFIASLAMIIGYAIVAVPTGIFAVEMSKARRADKMVFFACPSCGYDISDIDANYCQNCGYNLKK
ncbi:zinc-ribbon domain-containing protein [Deferribacter autotrophicus]|uniref:Zinc-ribbon domain-containing protein n=1 Tax=Deferribacter autotrophicus TaxID=500465 RepID=A0A5A8F5L4_9BACT|nr:ion transporter [Deferribacter autotrophicus]KAA0256919.1 zinc-ribbon domain-containing protein [Deferribacter autotrophicus]